MTNEATDRKKSFFLVITDSFRDLLFLLLIAFFILLYAGAMTGWFKPVSDLSFLYRIEPIIFLIVGYYFGRLPSERNENALKDEIVRQTYKADAAAQLKERALSERDVVEERIRNAKAVLLRRYSTHSKAVNCSAPELDPSLHFSDEGSIYAAVNILSS